jgi:predicted DNA-binding transcriptional regulator AlpA
MLGISSVTMWRWRNDPDMGFPRSVSINDRNYFRLLEVQTWIERQLPAA